MTEIPPIGDIKAFSGEDNHYRLRVGKFRVKYEYIMVDEIKEDDSIEMVKQLHIIDIDSRGDIYK